MAKKLTKAQKAKKAQSETSSSRRKFILLPVAAVAIGGTAFGLNALETGKRELHDLSVIGQGVPSIIQIHDPKCPTCRRLKNIVTNTLSSEIPVNYRLADITTVEGKALQSKYNVPNITLLYFDKRGKHVHTTQGLQTKEQISDTVNALFGSPT